MLPAFAGVRQHFGLMPDSTAPAQIISFFFMGQIVQIVFVVLSTKPTLSEPIIELNPQNRLLKIIRKEKLGYNIKFITANV